MSDVTLKIDGVSVTVPAGTTVLEAAKIAGIRIPTLCYMKDVNEIGACRMCLVETGGRAPAAACVMPVEALALDGKGALELTGKLGEVMQESAKLARSIVRVRAGAYGVDAAFFEKHDLHIHVPEGAVPKDGPSAGVALTCALMSAVTGIPAGNRLAMTGEITLRGKVLPIGGVKEKLLAAYRMGITEILLPKENERDLEKIDPEILKQFTIHPIAMVDEALKAVLVSETKGMRIAI